MLAGIVCVIMGIVNLSVLLIDQSAWWCGVAGGFSLGIGLTVSLVYDK